MITRANGARGRIDTIPGNQAQSGFQPDRLTDAILPSPAREVSNLSDAVPRSGIEFPTFTTRAELEAWEKGVRYQANRNMENAKPFARQMIAASRDSYIRRVTLAHLHLPEGEA